MKNTTALLLRVAILCSLVSGFAVLANSVQITDAEIKAKKKFAAF
jgi:hypothetical protein